jgi:hypothetical protein
MGLKMTVNNIKNKFIIVVICCLIGISIGFMVLRGLNPKAGELVSYEDDDRVNDTNYLDEPNSNLMEMDENTLNFKKY